jgi:Leucine-rich repeat (LRR) protein
MDALALLQATLPRLHLDGLTKRDPHADGRFQALSALTNLVELRLCKLGLSAIPPPVITLTRLTGRDASNNAHMRQIPVGISNLASLAILNLRSCALGASDYNNLQALSTLTNLVKLDLVSKQLRVMLPVFAAITRVTSLRMYNNHGLEVIHNGIANLANLAKLSLDSRASNTDLQPLGALSSLVSLQLFGPSLPIIPAVVTSLTQLTRLQVSGTGRLVTVPDGIGNLVKLATFILHHCGVDMPGSNDLQGLSRLTNLVALSISSAQLPYMPPAVMLLTRLTSLGVGFNEDLQLIPESISNLSNLATLRVDGCAFTLDELQKLSALHNLQELSISDLRLQTIPSAVTTLTRVTSLVMRDNQLRNCNIPAGISSLVNLRSLFLLDCMFQLPLSEHLLTLPRLERLEMSAILKQKYGKTTILWPPHFAQEAYGLTYILCRILLTTPPLAIIRTAMLNLISQACSGYTSSNKNKIRRGTTLTPPRGPCHKW